MPSCAVSGATPSPMPDDIRGASATAAVAVTVSGLVRGRELSGAGTAELGEDDLGIRIEPASGVTHGIRSVRLAFEAIDGLTYDPADRELVLFLSGGDVVELTGEKEAIGRLTRELRMKAATLRELTRALRTLGSHRGPTGSAHDRFFAPLLEARRRAERAQTLRARVDAFDPGVLNARLEEALRQLAAERTMSSMPDRRALEAELEELAEPIVRRLDRLHQTWRQTRESPDESWLLAWRVWSGSVAALFAEADRCWVAIAEALESAPPVERPRWWRRVFRRRDAAAEPRGA